MYGIDTRGIGPRKGEYSLRIGRIIALALVIALISATPAMALSAKGLQAVSVALRQVGKPYKLKSDAPNSFNCATLVGYCLNRVDSGKVTRNGIQGGYTKIGAMKLLDIGDVLCFKTTGSEIGILSYHFGIYMGKGYFVHASNSANKVIVSKVKDYAGRFLGAIRVF